MSLVRLSLSSAPLRNRRASKATKWMGKKHPSGVLLLKPQLTRSGVDCARRSSDERKKSSMRRSFIHICIAGLLVLPCLTWGYGTPPPSPPPAPPPAPPALQALFESPVTEVLERSSIAVRFSREKHGTTSIWRRTGCGTAQMRKAAVRVLAGPACRTVAVTVRASC